MVQENNIDTVYPGRYVLYINSLVWHHELIRIYELEKRDWNIDLDYCGFCRRIFHATQ